MSTSTLKPTARVNNEEGRIVVDVVWTGAPVDRPHTFSWSCGTGRTAPKLAQRLKRAIEAGAVFSSPRIVRDVNGRSYVKAEGYIVGRRMNSELSRRGF